MEIKKIIIDNTIVKFFDDYIEDDLSTIKDTFELAIQNSLKS